AAALAPGVPPGVHLKPVYDQAALVRDPVPAVRDAMLVGATLAVIVLLLFLRHGLITAISATSIPLTLAITMFVMSVLGQSFNLMTLGAMAIAIGLVIDDAVVVTENIARHMALSAARTPAIREAVQELIWPVTTSTITTVVVFLPLGLLQGGVGQFFAALATTLTVAVLVSLGLGRLVATGFLPEMDEGAFVLDYWTPGSTALDETNRQVGIAERILAETPEIAGTSRRTGAELGLFATAQNTGDVVARLVPRS